MTAISTAVLAQSGGAKVYTATQLETMAQSLEQYAALVDVAKGCTGLAVFVVSGAVWFRWDNRRLAEKQAERAFRGNRRGH